VTQQRPLIRKALITLVCMAVLAIYINRVVHVYLAQRTLDSLQAGSMERAIRLVPDDAEFPYSLGVQLSASVADSQKAITYLRKAVALNPNSGQYWLDLASAYQIAGDAGEENEAVQSALDAEPGNPEVAADAAKYFLAVGDVNQALNLYRQALAQNPQAAETILPVCWQQTRDANLLLAKLVPDSPELQLDLLRMLVQQKETPAANLAWQYIVTSKKSFDPQLSFFYFDYLLKEHEVASFSRAWSELAGLSPDLGKYLPNDNLIVNASFELPFLNSGFDWRYEPADHITAGIDDNVAHSGAHSLSLTYDGNPAYEAGWKQFVPLQGDADYEFSAWIKSENVTSSSGPRIAIVDAYSGVNLLLTEDVLDTHAWQQIKGSLRVPPSTELLVVKITRAPADTRIRGRVWIDDLRLVKR
jgi:hypothetical protein